MEITPEIISATKPVILVAGPTASGKSSMAMDIADEFGGVIINADSMQVYKELSIVTARPSMADEARVPHKLYGIISASQPWSVAQWLQRAVDEIHACHAAGKLPVVTGGTGLYFRALMHGIADIPEVPSDVRDHITARLASEGNDVLHGELSKVDPETAARISPSDTQRLIRATEVYLATGRSLSDWIAEGNKGVPKGFRFQPLVLEPPRDILYSRIDQRFKQMVNEGALMEVSKFAEHSFDPTLSAMKAVGIRELMAFESGDIPLEEAISRAQKVSRNYAKRQLTWFRNQIPEAKSYFAQYSESMKPEIFSFIRSFVLT